jgi:hypothetical protein
MIFECSAIQLRTYEGTMEQNDMQYTSNDCYLPITITDYRFLIPCIKATKAYE